MEKPLGVGLIGTGFGRRVQLPALSACPGVAVRVIASGRLERAEATAKAFGIPGVARDWREVVSHPDVGLVLISTPPRLHLEMALAALEAGKAVLCEKPLALDAHGARALWQRARERGGLALVDHELRFLPGYRLARQLVRAGELGELRHARVHFRGDARAMPLMPWTWWSDASQGGGILGALGVHAVDSLRFLLGQEPVEVLGALATHVTSLQEQSTGWTRPVTAEDEAQLLLRLRGGATAAVALSAVEPGEPLHAVELFGSRGALRIQGTALWGAVPGGHRWEPVELPAPEPLPPGLPDTEWARGFLALARAVAGALRAGGPPPEEAATFEDGWRNQGVLDAARVSHAERRWVALSALAPP
jgi:predicted dehydrogenase